MARRGDFAIAVLVLANLLIAGGCVAAYTGIAKLDDVPARSGSHVMGLFFDFSTMSFSPPAGETSARQDLLIRADVGNVALITPGACLRRGSIGGNPTQGGCTRVWGWFTLPADLTFASDMSGEVWLASSGTAVFSALQIAFYLENGNDLFAAVGMGPNRVLPHGDTSGNLQTSVERSVLGPIPKVFYLGGGFVDGQSGRLNLPAGTRIKVETTVWGVGYSGANSPQDIQLVFGSTKHPSAVYFTADPPASGWNPVGQAYRQFLTATALSATAPSSSVDQSRPAPPTGADVAAPAEWTWGSVAVGEGLRGTGVGQLTIWVTVQPDTPIGGGGTVGVAAHLYSDEKRVTTGFLGYTTAAFARTTTAATPIKLVIPIPFKGVELDPGAALRLAFQVYGVHIDRAGTAHVLYGSVVRPSLLMLPVVPSGAIAEEVGPATNETVPANETEPAPNSTSPTPSSSAAPPSSSAPPGSTGGSPAPSSPSSTAPSGESPTTSASPARNFFAHRVHAQLETNGSVLVTWQSPRGLPAGEIGGFLVWRGEAEPPRIGHLNDSSARSFLDDAANGTLSRYAVSAYDVNGEGFVDRIEDVPGFTDAEILAAAVDPGGAEPLSADFQYEGYWTGARLRFAFQIVLVVAAVGILGMILLGEASGPRRRGP